MKGEISPNPRKDEFKEGRGGQLYSILMRGHIKWKA